MVFRLLQKEKLLLPMLWIWKRRMFEQPYPLNRGFMWSDWTYDGTCWVSDLPAYSGFCFACNIPLKCVDIEETCEMTDGFSKADVHRGPASSSPFLYFLSWAKKKVHFLEPFVCNWKACDLFYFKRGNLISSLLRWIEVVEKPTSKI